MYTCNCLFKKKNKQIETNRIKKKRRNKRRRENRRRKYGGRFFPEKKISSLEEECIWRNWRLRSKLLARLLEPGVVSPNAVGKGGAILRLVSGQPPIDSSPPGCLLPGGRGVDSIPGQKNRARGGVRLVIHPSPLAGNGVAPVNPLSGRPIGCLWVAIQTSFKSIDRGEPLTSLGSQIVLCRWLVP